MRLSADEIAALAEARHGSPHDRLGLHPSGGGCVVRALLRDAVACEADAVPGGAAHPMARIHPCGLFEAVLPAVAPFRHRFRVTDGAGRVSEREDPYRFLPTLGEQDLHFLAQGDDHRIHEKLGGNLRVVDGVRGVAFAVWAPHARRVSVVGDFNGWDGRYHPMRLLGASGIWELFVPGLRPGDRYKYELVGPASPTPFLKTDPCAVAFEPSPHHAALVADLGAHAWGDAGWMAARARRDPLRAPMSVYEVHLGSWRRVPEQGDRPLTYRELGPALAGHCRSHGFTHVELLPPAEHPFDGSWGYQVTGYYAPTRRFGEAADFMAMVDTLHQAGIGVIIDLVPAHFPRDAFALARFDGTALYEHADPRQGEHPDWGTLVFNFGRHEVRNFLVGAALSWLDRFHVDGFRVDAVASMLYLDYSRKDGEWVPNPSGGRENLDAIAFLRQLNALVHHVAPGAVTIAEESTAFPGVTRPVAEGGLGFDLKWNMGWMHDWLAYFRQDPIHRRWHHDKLTFGMLYHWTERFVQALSHDEVVHGKGSLLGKMAGADLAAKAANLRCLLALQWAWPGKKTLFMGCEFGQAAEWSHERSLDWHLLAVPEHAGLLRLVGDLNRLMSSHPELSAADFDPGAFAWVQPDDAEQGVLAFRRHAGIAHWLVVANLTPVPRTYRLGVLEAGRWEEILNTDAATYAGSGQGNLGGVAAQARPCHGQDHSLELHLPGMSVLVLRPKGKG